MRAASFRYQTPGTRLWWSDLGQWVEAAHVLDRRRYSAARSRALAAHAAALPLTLIYAEDNAETLAAALDLLKYGPLPLGRPQRGHRAGAPQTPRIMAIANRLAKLKQANVGHNWRGAA
jgi:hypothetical protein